LLLARCDRDLHGELFQDVSQVLLEGKLLFGESDFRRIPTNRFSMPDIEYRASRHFGCGILDSLKAARVAVARTLRACGSLPRIRSRPAMNRRRGSASDSNGPFEPVESAVVSAERAFRFPWNRRRAVRSPRLRRACPAEPTCATTTQGLPAEA